jgi:hypothetical protein
MPMNHERTLLALATVACLMGSRTGNVIAGNRFFNTPTPDPSAGPASRLAGQPAALADRPRAHGIRRSWSRPCTIAWTTPVISFPFTTSVPSAGANSLTSLPATIPET